MKYQLFFLGLFFFQIGLIGQNAKDAEAVKKVLSLQEEAWNQGDIDTFMEYYWKSDNLQFIGKSGPVYGWKSTLERYKKGYPDQEAMGKLSFDIINLDQRSKKVISVVGKFKLDRTIGNLEGYFLLIFQKIKGQWVIVADHTS